MTAYEPHPLLQGMRSSARSGSLATIAPEVLQGKSAIGRFGVFLFPHPPPPPPPRIFCCIDYTIPGCLRKVC